MSSRTVGRLLVAAAGLAAAASVAAPATAEIEGDTLVDSEHGLRLELPRGWRASEVSAYPGVVVRLARTSPRVAIMVTVDPVVGPCADPLRFCTHDAIAATSVLLAQLTAAGFEITAQEQGRTPALEYRMGTRFLRHAVLVVGDQVVSVILAADSPTLRGAQARAFERMVQSVRALAPTTRRPAGIDDRELAPP